MTGEQLKERRLQLGLTQAELSELLQVQRPTIARWETGGTIRHGRVLQLALDAIQWGQVFR